jgi:uncharacterized protein YbjT (DUF2867 family)
VDDKGEHAPILVLGGTGHYGRHIVRSLLAKGQPVRVLSRNVSNARQVLGEKIEIIEGDITSRPSVVKVLKGVRAVVISVSAFSPKLMRKLKLIEQDSVLVVLEETEKAGVSRLVFMSIYDIRMDMAEKFKLESAEVKQAVERALAASGLNWTVLGASPSMEIFFSMIRGDMMVVPGGGPPALPTISPVDVGKIAAQAVLRDDLGGRRIRLAGPEPISFPEAAVRISRATGETIQFRAIPMILPRIARGVTGLLAPLNDTLYYAHHMLKYVELLNLFPADQAAEDHQHLLDTFDYTPTTLEMEIERRQKEQKL